MKEKEFLELSEEEITNTTRQINFTRIETLIDQKIGRSWVSSAGVCASRRRGQRMMIMIAVLICCFVGTVFAYQKGYLEAFWGSEVKEEQVVGVAASQESQGIRMTLAELAYGKTEVMAVMAFERTDGQPFPDHVDFANFQSWGKQKPSVWQLDERNNTANGELTDDGKTFLYCLYLYGNDQPLKGETLTVEADSLIGTEIKNVDFDINLSKLPDLFCADVDTDDEPPQHPQGNGDDWTKEQWDEYWGWQAQHQKWSDKIDETLFQGMRKQAKKADFVSLPLAEEYPDIRFGGMAFRGDMLYFALYVPWPTEKMSDVEKSTRNLAYISELKDQRNGNVYPCRLRGPNPAETDAGETFYTSVVEGITSADLPYLTPVITYELKELLSDGTWGFSYTFADDGVTVNQDMDLKYEDVTFPWKEPQYQGRRDVRFTEMMLSVFSFNLYGEWQEEENYGCVVSSQPEVKLVQKDGSEMTLIYAGGSALQDPAKIKLRYEYPPLSGEKSNKRFIDQDFVDQMEAIVIDGKTIPLKD